MESLLGGVEEERRKLDSVEEERRELGGVEEERRELGGVKEERREQGEESFGERTLKATSDNKLEEEPCEPQGANTTSSTSPNTDVTSSACPSEGSGGGTLSPRTGWFCQYNLSPQVFMWSSPWDASTSLPPVSSPPSPQVTALNLLHKTLSN